MTGKIVIKQVLSALLSFSGIHSFAERFCYSDKAFVLMYHRVLDTAAKQPYFVQPGMFVTTASLEKHITFLKDRFEVVFFDDLAEKISKGEAIGGHCAITFDDGWRDNYTAAFPVLEKHRVPATIFLATGFVGTDRIFWPEEICYYLDRMIVNESAFDDAPPALIHLSGEIDRFRQFKREVFFDKSIELLKGYSPIARAEILKYLRSLFKDAPFCRQMLNWGEAREMLASGLVRFGAHTVNHEILDQVPLQKARDEIAKSRADIEHRLGGKVRIFAYPNGNHSESIRKVLAENGFSAAVTTRKGFLGSGMPLMEVPRIAIHEDVSNTIPMFRSRILFRKF